MPQKFTKKAHCLVDWPGSKFEEVALDQAIVCVD